MGRSCRCSVPQDHVVTGVAPARRHAPGPVGGVEGGDGADGLFQRQGDDPDPVMDAGVAGVVVTVDQCSGLCGGRQLVQLRPVGVTGGIVDLVEGMASE